MTKKFYRYEFFTTSLMEAVAEVIYSNFPKAEVITERRTSTLVTNLPSKDMAQIMAWPHEPALRTE